MIHDSSSHSLIAHIDADSFFASVLMRVHPHLKGKPLLAIGMGGGCVIAASYEAKAKGVKTGMRLSDARKLCAGAIEMDSDFRETGLASEQIEEILKSACPIVEQMSIDEWFLDLRSMVGGCPEPELWAKNMQRIILQQTDLSVSIGVASSKLLAKMAGEYRKPAGVTVLAADWIEQFLRDRPAAAIPGIGRQRSIKTDEHHWTTAWDIATAPEADLVRICGRPGIDMQRELLGERVDKVAEDTRPPKSISRCRTFKGTDDKTFVKAHLLKHLEYCIAKMRRQNLACTDISVWIRSNEFSHIGSHRHLPQPCVTASRIVPVVLAALGRLTWHGKKWNQVGLALSGLVPQGPAQHSLFEEYDAVLADEHLQAAVDTIHDRFGRDSLTRATALPVKSGTKKELELPMV